MKRIFALLLVLCMVFSFTACKKDNTEPSNKESINNTNSANKENIQTNNNANNSNQEGILSNTYETPLKLRMDLVNAKCTDEFVNAAFALHNGFCETEMREAVGIFMKTNSLDADDIEDVFKKRFAKQTEQYGDDYKISYTINGKETLGQAQFVEMEEKLKKAAETVKSMVDAYNDTDASEKKAWAERWQISETELKTMYENYQKLYDGWMNCDVTEGYELDVTYKITGSKLNEAKEEKASVLVFKVNGRWVYDDYLFAG